jgi:type VI secretion system protein ImpA
VSEHTAAIEAGFTQHVGFGPDLSKLRARLEEVVRTVAHRLVERGAGVDDSAVVTDDAGGDQPSAGPAAASPLTGEIGSRQQVVEALDKICAYFERHEPTSPVPLLLQRAKRLVNMSFLEIIRDIASSAVDQVDALRGRGQDESD